MHSLHGAFFILGAVDEIAGRRKAVSVPEERAFERQGGYRHAGFKEAPYLPCSWGPCPFGGAMVIRGLFPADIGRITNLESTALPSGDWLAEG